MTVAGPLVVMLGMLLAFTGCREASPASALPTVAVRIGQKVFTLEIVANAADREKGLMHRESMPADRGMIFVFPDEAVRGFWMRNTKIPLDILYLDGGGRVISIHPLEPFDETPVRSAGLAKYAIELNQGSADEAGVKVGYVIDIPVKARDTAE